MLTGKRAETQEERLQILEMRTETYRQAGKHTSSELMIDQFDEDAILFAFIPHRMYFVDVLTTLSGRGVDQLAWLSIWPDVAASALSAQGNPTAREVLARYRYKILGGRVISQMAFKAVRAHRKSLELVKMVMGRLSPAV